MKRKTAKELLAESFQELAEQKPIDKITVQDIVENAGYSPATFYRQFKDKYDLIAWDYTRRLESIMSRIGVDEYPWRQTLIDAANLFQSQKEYLANLFLHTSGMDSFFLNMTEINFRHLRACIMANAETDTLDETVEMCIRLYVLGTVSLTCEWILDRWQATPQVLAEVYETSLPELLRPYLC